MSQKEWFKEWFDSSYYHKLYFSHNDTEASKFITKLTNFLSPAKGSLMVDVACGKGRHAKILAAESYDVTGIDLSPNSIAEAKKSETNNLHFFVHDMRLPFWINFFDYAFNFFTSFGYFNTKREHENSLRTIVQSLKPGGTFTMDYLNTPYAQEHFNPSFETEKDGVKFFIKKWFDEKHFYKEITVDDKALARPLVFNEMIEKFSANDLVQMLEKHQMQVQQVFGDYDLAEYSEKKSPRIIIISKKPQ